MFGDISNCATAGKSPIVKTHQPQELEPNAMDERMLHSLDEFQ